MYLHTHTAAASSGLHEIISFVSHVTAIASGSWWRPNGRWTQRCVDLALCLERFLHRGLRSVTHMLSDLAEGVRV